MIIKNEVARSLHLSRHEAPQRVNVSSIPRAVRVRNLPSRAPQTICFKGVERGETFPPRKGWRVAYRLDNCTLLHIVASVDDLAWSVPHLSSWNISRHITCRWTPPPPPSMSSLELLPSRHCRGGVPAFFDISQQSIRLSDARRSAQIIQGLSCLPQASKKLKEDLLPRYLRAALGHALQRS